MSLTLLGQKLNPGLDGAARGVRMMMSQNPVTQEQADPVGTARKVDPKAGGADQCPKPQGLPEKQIRTHAACTSTSKV